MFVYLCLFTYICLVTPNYFYGFILFLVENSIKAIQNQMKPMCMQSGKSVLN